MDRKRTDLKIQEAEKERVDETGTKKMTILRRILNIASYVLIGALVVLDIFALYSKITMKGESGGISFFGKEARIVLTGSMEGSEDFYKTEGKDYSIKALPVHSLVFIERAPALSDVEASHKFYSDIKVNDILTFYHQLGGTNYVVTHRVISIDSSNPKHIHFVLRGDNPEGDKVVSKYSYTQDAYSDTGLIIGKVTGVNNTLGQVLYTFVENKIVFIFIIIVPSALLMFYEIGNVIFYLYLSKKEKAEVTAKAEMDAKDEELERLRKQIEEIQKKGK